MGILHNFFQFYEHENFQIKSNRFIINVNYLFTNSHVSEHYQNKKNNNKRINKNKIKTKQNKKSEMKKDFQILKS